MKIKLLIAFIVFIFANVQVNAKDCDAACLKDIALQYLQALLKQDYRDLPWGEQVDHTENDVGLMIGEGLWGTATAVSDDRLLVADANTGNVIWMGIVEEHGQPAYLGLRLRVEDQKITEVETVVGREGGPSTFAKTDGYQFGGIFSEKVPKKQSRSKMTKLVQQYYDSVELNNGKVSAKFADDCSRRENGVATTDGDVYWAAKVAKGCQQQLAIGLYKSTDSIRHVRFPVVDEETGVVIALSLHDHAVRETSYTTSDGQEVKVPIEYPYSYSKVEVFKIVDGKIQKIESYSAIQPYYMPTQWAE